jgi:type I restriction enzyme S subunit
LPPGWTATTLGEIGEYHNGRGFKKAEWSQTGRPIIRIQNLTDAAKPFNHYEGDDVDPRHEVHPGDLLVSWAATLDVFRWGGSEAVLNQHIFKVDSYIDPDFHFYVLKRMLNALYAQSHGSGMVHITRARFDSTPVALPPLEEQRQIASELRARLMSVEAGERHMESALSQLPVFREAVLVAAITGRLSDEDGSGDAAAELAEILRHRQDRWAAAAMGRYTEPQSPRALDLELPHGWTWATIDQLAVGVQYGTSQKTTEDPSRAVPVLRMGNVVDGKLDFSTLKYLPEDHYEFPGLLLDEGDILFNRTNSAELVGKTAVARGLPPKCSFASYLIRVRVVQGVVPEWVAYFINSPFGRGWIRNNVSQQVGQANVNGAKLRGLTLPLPPIGTQRRLVAEVQRLAQAAADLERRLTSAVSDGQALRASLLHHALTGALVPRQSSGETAAEPLERLAVERQRRANARKAVRGARGARQAARSS